MTLIESRRVAKTCTKGDKTFHNKSCNFLRKKMIAFIVTIRRRQAKRAWVKLESSKDTQRSMRQVRSRPEESVTCSMDCLSRRQMVRLRLCAAQEDELVLCQCCDTVFGRFRCKGFFTVVWARKGGRADLITSPLFPRDPRTDRLLCMSSKGVG
jgi:hypothetical protein